ncbi:Hypothetical predicted protein [Pelobates cultripes]|uniref:Uncharacterized protein n=1 Tax=Pelobates cultripes TaxID=61616 RepID=A0AAD1THC8_PELCU|nr:Hypothetical predicted protein [Pelobates cultripes]
MSEDQAMDELDEFPSSGGLHLHSSEDSELPSTKGDIKALLRNFCMLFATDVATLREEIQAVEGRVKTTEGDTKNLAARCVHLEAQNTEIQHSQSQITTRLNDRHRSRNLKIRGISETVALGDLTLHRETAYLPAHTATSKPSRDRWNLPHSESRQSSSRHPTDIILQLRTRTAHRTLMTAVRSKANHLFENATLSFYQELSRPTVLWRSRLKPLTATLRQHSVPYRWAFPRSLITPHGGATTRLTDTAEMDSNPVSTTQAPRQQPPHIWDMAKVQSFLLSVAPTSSATAFRAQRAGCHTTDT